MQQSERSAFFTPICELPPIPGREENCSDPVLMRQLRDLQKDRCEISHAINPLCILKYTLLYIQYLCAV